MKRTISAFIGIFLIGVVIYLGIKSGGDNKYIVAYGLTSALIAPMGLSALNYSIKRKNDALQKLSKIPQIDELIEQAETEEEKIRRLKKEKDVLLDYIKRETKRISKIERKKILEAEARRILDEYKQVVDEINAMPDSDIDLENVSEEIQELYNIQSEKLNENRSSERGFDLAILGINYTVQGLLDIYGLPGKKLVDNLDRCMREVLEVIQKLARGILNVFNKS